MGKYGRLAWIALGGGLGSVARFGVILWFEPFHVWAPTSILLINVIGSFVIAVVHFLSVPGLRLGITAREFLMVGFCGGFTTFSSFCYLEYVALARWNWGDAALNLALSHAWCLAAAWLGFCCCQTLERWRRPPRSSVDVTEGQQALSEEENA